MSTAKQPCVCVLMGSPSDHETMQHCINTLQELGIKTFVKIASAHRTPEQVIAQITQADQNDCRAFIAAAGLAAHLAGMVAAHTQTPVIGVPLKAELDGLDALLSTVQMPAGCPVACMAIGKAGAINAAILAAQMIASTEPAVAEQLLAFKQKTQASRTKKADEIHARYAHDTAT
jgi:5-(carboxyamino)imidazole ribonucleotide mutase